VQCCYNSFLLLRPNPFVVVLRCGVVQLPISPLFIFTPFWFYCRYVTILDYVFDLFPGVVRWIRYLFHTTCSVPRFAFVPTPVPTTFYRLFYLPRSPFAVGGRSFTAYLCLQSKIYTISHLPADYSFSTFIHLGTFSLQFILRSTTRCWCSIPHVALITPHVTFHFYSVRSWVYRYCWNFVRVNGCYCLPRSTITTVPFTFRFAGFTCLLPVLPLIRWFYVTTCVPTTQFHYRSRLLRFTRFTAARLPLRYVRVGDLPIPLLTCSLRSVFVTFCLLLFDYHWYSVHSFDHYLYSILHNSFDWPHRCFYVHSTIHLFIYRCTAVITVRYRPYSGVRYLHSRSPRNSSSEHCSTTIVLIPRTVISYSIHSVLIHFVRYRCCVILGIQFYDLLLYFTFLRLHSLPLFSIRCWLFWPDEPVPNTTVPPLIPIRPYVHVDAVAITYVCCHSYCCSFIYFLRSHWYYSTLHYTFCDTLTYHRFLHVVLLHSTFCCSVHSTISGILFVCCSHVRYYHCCYTHSTCISPPDSFRFYSIVHSDNFYRYVTDGNFIYWYIHTRYHSITGLPSTVAFCYHVTQPTFWVYRNSRFVVPRSFRVMLNFGNLLHAILLFPFHTDIAFYFYGVPTVRSHSAILPIRWHCLRFVLLRFTVEFLPRLPFLPILLCISFRYVTCILPFPGDLPLRSFTLLLLISLHVLHSIRWYSGRSTVITDFYITVVTIPPPIPHYLPLPDTVGRCNTTHQLVVRSFLPTTVPPFLLPRCYDYIPAIHSRFTANDLPIL